MSPKMEKVTTDISIVCWICVTQERGIRYYILCMVLNNVCMAFTVYKKHFGHYTDVLLYIDKTYFFDTI